MSGMGKKIAGKVLLPVAALFVLSILVFRERAGIGCSERMGNYIYGRN